MTQLNQKDKALKLLQNKGQRNLRTKKKNQKMKKMIFKFLQERVDKGDHTSNKKNKDGERIENQRRMKEIIERKVKNA